MGKMGDPTEPSRQILLVECPDRSGLVHQITGVLYHRGANILTNHEFVDREHNHFVMRTEFSGARETDTLVGDVERLLPPAANVRLAAAEKRRIVVLATAEHHCLGELLMRHAHDDLGASIEAVVSNHTTLGPLATRFDVPFHHVTQDNVSRQDHEAAVLKILERYQPEYIVLAKYMRILSDDFVERYRNRIINIHHSFLPAFVGPKPYRQAFERGVKIIGATVHFVTADLDQGAIIAQAVLPVDHTCSPADMARVGRDVEKTVLAKALRSVFEERVFLIGNRTIVFE